MSIQEELTKAIAAHGLWKHRLRDAIQKGSSDFKVDAVSTDHQCDFGRWFYGISPDARKNELAESIQRLHAEFHREAGRILGLALHGHKLEAEEALGMQGEFTRLSAELTTLMSAWKKSGG